MKKLISRIILAVILINNINISLVSASTPIVVTMYENDFSDGAAGIPSAKTDGYAAENEFLLFDGYEGQPLKTVKNGTDTGVRVDSPMWYMGRTFLFDFTKNGQKEGIHSSKVTLSFDFSIDGESTANQTIMGMNMSDASSGGRMTCFRNASYEIFDNVGDSSNAANACAIEAGQVYAFKVIMDFDEGKAEYYIDNEHIKTQSNRFGETMNNFSIAMSGVIGYFDNLKLTIELPYIYTMYRNDFSDGAVGIPSAKTDGYAAENEFLLFDGYEGQPLKTVKNGTDTGVRVDSPMWYMGRTFLFDFTKNGQKEGIRSGKATLSFDFSIDGESTANQTIMGINMSDASSGGRIACFRNASYEIFDNVGDSSNAANACAIEAGQVYAFKVIMDFDEGKADYYIDNEHIKTQTNWLGEMMNNFSIALSGVIEYFDNLKLTIEYPKPIETIVTSDNAGNIFYEDEQVMMKVNVKNRHNSDVSEDISVKVTDSQNNVVWSKETMVELSAGESKDFMIYPEISRYGTYFLKTESDNGTSFGTRLSKSVKAIEKNEKLGVCAHFDGRYKLDVSAVFDIISAAGFSGVRTDWGWRTNSDGTVYGFLEDGGIFEATIKEANESQTDILALITIDNESVSQYNTDGGLNTSSEALAAYEKYLEELSGMLAGKVKYFQIGNENNYTTRPATLEDIENGVAVINSKRRVIVDNRGVCTYSGVNDYVGTWYDKDKVTVTIKTETENNKPVSKLTAIKDGVTIIDSVPAYVFDTGDNYYKILKAAYSGIKKGNPEAMVITSGCGLVYQDPNGVEYSNMRTFAEGLLGTMQEQKDYCFDGYGVHPYHTAKAPEETDFYIQNTNWYMQAECGNSLFAEFDVPKEKQIWATEFGYSAYDDINSSEDAEKETAWLIRTVLANEIGGYHDKMFIYDILNDGLDVDEGEHNFGLINYYEDKTWNERSAYSAKPQYLAVAQYNKIMAGTEFVKNEITDGSLYTAEFKKQGDEIFVLWDTADSGRTVELAGCGKVVNIYDMYGNLTESKFDEDKVLIEAGEKPVYVQSTYITTNISFSENGAIATVVNDSEEEIMPVLIAALYDENDKLISISFSKDYTVKGTEVDSVGVNEIAEMKIDLNSAGTKVKVMLFQNLNSLVPLCAGITR